MRIFVSELHAAADLAALLKKVVAGPEFQRREFARLYKALHVLARLFPVQRVDRGTECFDTPGIVRSRVFALPRPLLVQCGR